MEHVIKVLQGFRKLLIAEDNRTNLMRFNNFHHSDGYFCVCAVETVDVETQAESISLKVGFSQCHREGADQYFLQWYDNEFMLDSSDPELLSNFTLYDVVSCKVSEVDLIDYARPSWDDVRNLPTISTVGIYTLWSVFREHFGHDHDLDYELEEFYHRFFQEDHTVSNLELRVVWSSDYNRHCDVLIVDNSELVGVISDVHSRYPKISALSNTGMTNLMVRIQQEIHAAFGEPPVGESSAWNLIDPELDVENYLKVVGFTKSN